MATGIVRSAICCVLTESDPTQDSCGEWIKESRQQICKFLQEINEDQALEIFDKFSSSLLWRSVFLPVSRVRGLVNLSAWKEKNFGVPFIT